MALWMLLFWGGVIVLVVWAVRAIADGGRRREDEGNRAIQILEERFARGEIDQEELEQRRSTLEGR